MTAAIDNFRQRIRQRTAPLFERPDPMAEHVPAGFVGNQETADLREKLQELLETPKAIANELDRRAAKRMFDEERRLTKAEAELVDILYGNYESRRSGPGACNSRGKR